MENKINLDKKQILGFLGKSRDMITKKSGIILIFFAAVSLGYCGYLWYKFVMYPSWSAEQKQAYVSLTEKKGRFDQKKFDTVIAEIERRKSEYNTKLENIPDIFRLK